MTVRLTRHSSHCVCLCRSTFPSFFLPSLSFHLSSSSYCSCDRFSPSLSPLVISSASGALILSFILSHSSFILAFLVTFKNRGDRTLYICMSSTTISLLEPYSFSTSSLLTHTIIISQYMTGREPGYSHFTFSLSLSLISFNDSSPLLKIF